MQQLTKLELDKMEKLLDKTEAELKEERSDNVLLKSDNLIHSVKKAVDLYTVLSEEICNSLYLEGYIQHKNIIQRITRGFKYQCITMLRYCTKYFDDKNLISEQIRLREDKRERGKDKENDKLLQEKKLISNDGDGNNNNNMTTTNNNLSSNIQKKLINNTGPNIELILNANKLIQQENITDQGLRALIESEEFQLFQKLINIPTAVQLMDGLVKNVEQSLYEQNRKKEEIKKKQNEHEKQFEDYLQEHKQITKQLDDIISSKKQFDHVQNNDFTENALKQVLRGLDYTTQKVKGVKGVNLIDSDDEADIEEVTKTLIKNNNKKEDKLEKEKNHIPQPEAPIKVDTEDKLCQYDRDIYNAEIDRLVINPIKEKFQQELKEKNGEIRDLNNRANMLEKENNANKKTILELRVKIANFDVEKNGLINEIRALKDLKLELETALENQDPDAANIFKTENERLSKEKHNMVLEANQLKRHITQLEYKIEELNSYIRELEQKLKINPSSSSIVVVNPILNQISLQNNAINNQDKLDNYEIPSPTTINTEESNNEGNTKKLEVNQIQTNSETKNKSQIFKNQNELKAKNPPIQRRSIVNDMKINLPLDISKEINVEQKSKSSEINKEQNSNEEKNNLININKNTKLQVQVSENKVINSKSVNNMESMTHSQDENIKQKVNIMQESQINNIPIPDEKNDKKSENRIELETTIGNATNPNNVLQVQSSQLPMEIIKNIPEAPSTIINNPIRLVTPELLSTKNDINLITQEEDQCRVELSEKDLFERFVNHFGITNNTNVDDIIMIFDRYGIDIELDNATLIENYRPNPKHIKHSRGKIGIIQPKFFNNGGNAYKNQLNPAELNSPNNRFINAEDEKLETLRSFKAHSVDAMTSNNMRSLSDMESNDKIKKTNMADLKTRQSCIIMTPTKLVSDDMGYTGKEISSQSENRMKQIHQAYNNEMATSMKISNNMPSALKSVMEVPKLPSNSNSSCANNDSSSRLDSRNKKEMTRDLSAGALIQSNNTSYPKKFATPSSLSFKERIQLQNDIMGSSSGYLNKKYITTGMMKYGVTNSSNLSPSALDADGSIEKIDLMSIQGHRYPTVNEINDKIVEDMYKSLERAVEMNPNVKNLFRKYMMKKKKLLGVDRNTYNFDFDINFEDFKDFVHNFTQRHKKCGESCIHLKRFFDKIGFRSKSPMRPLYVLHKTDINKLPKIKTKVIMRT